MTPWRLDAGDHPDWSPNGRRILFRAPANDEFLGSNLYTIGVDGSKLKRLTHFGSASGPLSSSYSPDGRWVVFGRISIGKLPDLYRPGGRDRARADHPHRSGRAPPTGVLRSVASCVVPCGRPEVAAALPRTLDEIEDALVAIEPDPSSPLAHSLLLETRLAFAAGDLRLQEAARSTLCRSRR